MIIRKFITEKEETLIIKTKDNELEYIKNKQTNKYELIKKNKTLILSEKDKKDLELILEYIEITEKNNNEELYNFLNRNKLDFLIKNYI